MLAFGNNSNKIRLGDNRLCKGSVDIDKGVEKLYPQENRWDYCFSYNDEIYFVEVHPANTSEVPVIINKLSWLKNWLRSQAPLINQNLAVSQKALYWVQSGRFGILPNSRQHKLAAQNGIIPISSVRLP